jgi:hypothetical protein
MATLDSVLANSIDIPLSSSDLSTAEAFAAAAGPFADRVQQNTLAVLAANHYLSWQGFDTNISAGDSWHPALRLLSDTADLEIVGVGKLECRVVSPGASAVDVPLEVSADRIGFLILQISEAPLAAKLLGFFALPTDGLAPTSFPLAELQDMDQFIDLLYNIRSGLDVLSQLPAFDAPCFSDASFDRLSLIIRLNYIFYGSDQSSWRDKALSVFVGSGNRSDSKISALPPMDDLEDIIDELLPLLAAQWLDS